MRRAFIQTLTQLADAEPRLLLLTADLGFSVIEPFAHRFPNRFFNVGVAEQNMVGIASGLADAGFIPFIYSITPFLVLRPLEFIRNGPVQHQLPVRLVSVGGGFEYGPAGHSHHGLEDLAVLRTLPGLVVTAPADPLQAVTILSQTLYHPGPVYFRLGKDEESILPELEGRFRMGGAERIGCGKDLLLITTGSQSIETQRAAALLLEQGVACSLLVVACLAPAPVEDLRLAMVDIPVVITVEEHVLAGGLGSLTAEVIAESGWSRRFLRLGVSTLDNKSGNHAWLKNKHGLSAPAITQQVMEFMAK
ncbi:MAG: 1-deoxy-D-xylulose-5-phosphate synthase [Magnetococcales bacterium]|nr:1-deoxy-D-xylulose-5-phosphate synthase [Magnetococcales bacterium]